jgi:hypothetical protein
VNDRWLHETDHATRARRLVWLANLCRPGKGRLLLAGDLAEIAEHQRVLALTVGSAGIPSQCGPALPVALCKCGHKLTFEQMRWRGRLVISTGWRCHCEGCVDGEYVGDPLTLQMTVVSGEGESPWEALDDLAAMHFDLMPEDLLVKEGP